VVAPVIPGTDCTLALSVPSLAIVKPSPTFTPPRVSEEAVGRVYCSGVPQVPFPFRNLSAFAPLDGTRPSLVDVNTP